MMEVQSNYIFISNPNYVSPKSDEMTIYFPTGLIKTLIKKFPNIKKKNKELNVNDVVADIRSQYVEHNGLKYEEVFELRSIGKVVYLNVIVSGNEMVNIVECMEEVQKRLSNFEENEEYIPYISYDAVSEYYCNKIYPELNRLERNLRRLMLNVYIFRFNLEYDKTIVDKKIRKKIKKNNNAYSSTLLDQCTYSDYEKILFDKKWTVLEDEYKNKILNDNKDLSKLNDKDLRDYIDFLSPKSDWDRFFKEKVNFDDIQLSISKIRKYRNDIAHCKKFYNNEYNECLKLLNTLNKSFEDAIQITQNEDVLKSYSDRFKELVVNMSKEIMDSLIGSLNELNEVIIDATKRVANNYTDMFASLPIELDDEED